MPDRILLAYLPLLNDGRAIHFKVYTLVNGDPVQQGDEHIVSLPGDANLCSIHTAPSMVWDTFSKRVLVYFCGKKGPPPSLTWSLWMMTMDLDFQIQSPGLTEITATADGGDQVLMSNPRSTPAAFIDTSVQSPSSPFVACGTKSSEDAVSLFAPAQSSGAQTTTENSEPVQRDAKAGVQEPLGATRWMTWPLRSSGQPKVLTMNGACGAAVLPILDPIVYLAFADAKSQGNVCVATQNMSDLKQPSHQDDFWPTTKLGPTNAMGPMVTPLVVTSTPLKLYLLYYSVKVPSGISSVELQSNGTIKKDTFSSYTGHFNQGQEDFLVSTPNSFQIYGSAIAALHLSPSLYMAFMGLNLNLPDRYHNLYLVKISYDTTFGNITTDTWTFQTKVSDSAMKPAMCFIPEVNPT